MVIDGTMISQCQGRQKMKPLIEITRHLTGSEKPTSDALDASINELHIERLWERMVMVYGHKWVSGYGDHDDGTWFNALKTLTPKHLSRGLNRCLDRESEWPPPLNVFKNYCLDKKEKRGLTHNTAAYRIQSKQKQIERKANPVIAADALEEMRRKLKR